MVKVADRVKVSTATTGTGTITLGSAVSGFVVVPSSLNNQTLRYVIEENDAFEIGTGTYTHSGTTLSRTLTVSSTGSLLNLSGSATVFLSLAAVDIQELLDFSNLFSLPSSDGSSGQSLITDGSGNLSFSTISGGGGSSLSDPIKQTEFTGSATTTFSVNYTAGNINVFLNGSKLAASDFTATNGTSVVLGSACAASDVVTVVEYGSPFASQYSSTIFTVGTSSEYNTSSKILTTTYTASKVAIYLNGVKLLVGTDCVATNGTTINLTNAAPVTGDKIEIVEHGALADSITALTGLTDTPSSLGSAGQVLQVNSGGNALEFSDAGGGVTVYNNYSNLPSSGNTDGDLGWVKDISGSGATKALYVWDGSEWDRVYSDAQEVVSFTTSPNAAYTLAGGQNTDVTVAATDPDGFPISYSVLTNPTNQAQATITQPSTGTFRFAASNSSSNAGSFTCKFIADDGVTKATASSSFSLTFSIWTGLTNFNSTFSQDSETYQSIMAFSEADFDPSVGFNANGTEFFSVRGANVYKYTVNPAYSTTLSSRTSVFSGMYSGNNNSSGGPARFVDGGSKFIYQTAVTTVAIVSLTSAYDLSTAGTASTQSLNGISKIHSMAMSSDGTKLLIGEDQSMKVYSLSSAFDWSSDDFSTATPTTVDFSSLSTLNSSFDAVSIIEGDGLRLFVVFWRFGVAQLVDYTFGTAGNYTTLTETSNGVSSLSLNSNTYGGFRGAFFKEDDGSKLFSKLYRASGGDKAFFTKWDTGYN